MTQSKEKTHTLTFTPLKPILREYCDFIDIADKTINSLQKRLDDHCKIIGCKHGEKEPFMECNVGCPLFFAWQRLDQLKKAIEEDEVKPSS